MGLAVHRLIFNLPTAFAAAWRLALLMLIATLAITPGHALDPKRTLDQLHHTSWTARDGMPTNILSIAQTPDGFLWLAAPDGLYRFDGIQAERFEAHTIFSTSISAVATSANGDLWVVSASSKLARISGKKIVVLDIPAPGIKGGVAFLAPDPDGTLWLSTRDTVLNFDGQSWRTIEHPWDSAATWSDPGGVWGMALADDGTLWAKNLTGLYYLRRGTKAFKQAPGYGGGVIDFARDPSGRLWTSDYASERFYTLPNLPSESPPPLPSFGAEIAASIRGSVIIDRDGTLWNANRVTGGLHRTASLTAPAPTERFTLQEGLTSDLVLSVFEDREGNIWVATANGLERFRHANIVVEPNIPVRLQAAQLVVGDEGVFLYTGMSAPNVSDAGQRLLLIRPGQSPELLAASIGQVEAMAAAPDGSLVFAEGGKLHRWDEDGVTPIPISPDFAGGHVWNLVVSENGEIWVSVHENGVYRLAEGRWTRVAVADQRAGTPSLALDRAGATWLFYQNGESVRAQGANLRRFPSDTFSGSTAATLSDRAGGLIVGRRGLVRFTGTDFQAPVPDLLRDLASIFGIVQMPDGDVWIGSRSGILRIGHDDLLRSFSGPDIPTSAQLFDVNDGYTGLPPADVTNTSMVLGHDGRIWLFMNTGLAWIDPKNLYHNSEPPPVVVTSLIENGRRHDMPHMLSLPAGTSQLEVDYTALSLAIPERIRFRYRLDGVDRDWVEAGHRRQAFYTNLPPGEHRFHVIAANNDGVWNTTGATLAFTIAPTFVQSVWFQFLVVLVLVAMAWLFYTLRLRQQAARLHSRFQVRIAERERIARELHDTLLQGVQGLLLRFQSISNRVPHGELRTSLEDALDRADAVLVEGRARVRDLRTTGFEGDLAKMIVRKAHETIDGDVPRFVLTVEGSVRPLHQLATEEACRISEEAIRNAVAHADAKMIEAILSYRASGLHLIVRDDGVGLPEAVRSNGEKSGHYGLKGMRERAKRVGGRLAISSRPNAGTEVVLTIPSRAAYSDSRRLFAWRRALPGDAFK